MYNKFLLYEYHNINRYIVMRKYIIYLLIIFISFSCTQEKKMKDEIKTKTTLKIPQPTNLSFQKTDLNSIKLTWKYKNNEINGFKIDKKVNKGNWIIAYGKTFKNIKDWVDDNAEINHYLQYRIYAYSKEGQSDPVKTESINNYLPSPHNIRCDDNINSVKLTWTLNDTRIDGFIIDKKIDGEQWYENYDATDETQNEWVDDNIKGTKKFKYRICSYFRNYKSKFIETDWVDRSQNKPENLKYSTNGDTIRLSWDLSGIEADSFFIARKAGSQNWNKEYCSIPGNQFYWSEIVISPIDYYYKIGLEINENDYIFSEFIKYTPDKLWSDIPENEYCFYGSPSKKYQVKEKYKIMKYEVTNEQYARFLSELINNDIIKIDSFGVYLVNQNFIKDYSDSYSLIDLYDEDCPIEWNEIVFKPRKGYNDHPVCEVTWFGAQAYAKYYQLALPTIEQWLCASKGATGNNINGLFGNFISENNNNFWLSGDPFEKNKWEIFPQTTPCGFYNNQLYKNFKTQKLNSIYDVYDFWGNVSEWTSSYIINDHGDKSFYMIGGNFSEYIEIVEKNFLKKKEPGYDNYYTGFRCVYLYD